MFDIRVFNALATQTSIKIGQISFNVTTPIRDLREVKEAGLARKWAGDTPLFAVAGFTLGKHRRGKSTSAWETRP